MRVLGWLVALLAVPLCGFLMTQVEMPVQHANVAPSVQAPAEVKQYVPTYQLECGEAIGPDLREKTKVDKALFIVPAECESGIIMLPRNLNNMTVEGSEPVTGNWYFKNNGDEKEGSLNMRKSPWAASTNNGELHHTWGIPTAFDINNPQKDSVTVTAKFLH